MKAFTCALLASCLSPSAAVAAADACPFREEGAVPWSASVPKIVDGDFWAWIYLDLDKKGRPQRCYIGETNISSPGTKSNVCTSFVTGWQAVPLMKDGQAVAGTTRRFFVIAGDKHWSLLSEARKRWFAEHPGDNPDCYPGSR